MNILEIIVRIIVIILVSFLCFVILYFLVEFCCSRITIKGETNFPKEVTIYIITNGDHTDIVVPVRSDIIDWDKEIKYDNTLSKDTSFQYLAIGWGDKGFYLETPTWSQLKLSVAFKAVFGINSTAMHATYYKQMEESNTCRKIIISKEQYFRLVTFIVNKFQRDGNGHFINIETNANYGDTDAFYEAKGRYSLFYTCNTWSNEALRKCGQKSCLWTVFDTGIFLKYKTTANNAEGNKQHAESFK